MDPLYIEKLKNTLNQEVTHIPIIKRGIDLKHKLTEEEKKVVNEFISSMINILPEELREFPMTIEIVSYFLGILYTALEKGNIERLLNGRNGYYAAKVIPDMVLQAFDNGYELLTGRGLDGENRIFYYNLSMVIGPLIAEPCELIDNLTLEEIFEFLYVGDTLFDRDPTSYGENEYSDSIRKLSRSIWNVIYQMDRSIENNTDKSLKVKDWGAKDAIILGFLEYTWTRYGIQVLGYSMFDLILISHFYKNFQKDISFLVEKQKVMDTFTEELKKLIEDNYKKLNIKYLRNRQGDVKDIIEGFVDMMDSRVMQAERLRYEKLFEFYERSETQRVLKTKPSLYERISNYTGLLWQCKDLNQLTFAIINGMSVDLEVTIEMIKWRSKGTKAELFEISYGIKPTELIKTFENLYEFTKKIEVAMRLYTQLDFLNDPADLYVGRLSSLVYTPNDIQFIQEGILSTELINQLQDYIESMKLHFDNARIGKLLEVTKKLSSRSRTILPKYSIIETFALGDTFGSFNEIGNYDSVFKEFFELYFGNSIRKYFDLYDSGRLGRMD